MRYYVLVFTDLVTYVPICFYTLKQAFNCPIWGVNQIAFFVTETVLVMHFPCLDFGNVRCIPSLPSLVTTCGLL